MARGPTAREALALVSAAATFVAVAFPPASATPPAPGPTAGAQPPAPTAEPAAAGPSLAPGTSRAAWLAAAGGGDATADATPAPDVAATMPVEPAPSATPEPRSFTVAATGDLLVHAPVRNRAAEHAGWDGFDFAPLFAEVAPVLGEADLAICHLETPLTTDASDLSSYPVFNVPAELAHAVAGSGWDACSTASNHSMDRGMAGITATLDALDDAGLPHAGMARTAAEAEAPTLVEAGGATVGMVSATYGLNGFVVPADAPWAVTALDAEVVLEQARAARAAGAELVVASLHWGEEYRTDPTEQQRELARTLLADGPVDLIIGHHAHVVQPVERLGDRWVAYGLGNIVSAQVEGCCRGPTQDGVVLRAHVEEVGDRLVVTGVDWVPTRVEPGSWRVRAIPAALDDHTLPAWQRAELEASAARTDATMRVLGVEPHLNAPTPGTAGPRSGGTPPP